jgi:hypothetical protein
MKATTAGCLIGEELVVVGRKTVQAGVYMMSFRSGSSLAWKLACAKRSTPLLGADAGSAVILGNLFAAGSALGLRTTCQRCKRSGDGAAYS